MNMYGSSTDIMVGVGLQCPLEDALCYGIYVDVRYYDDA